MPVSATKEPASATPQQKMPASACWDTYAHLKRSRQRNHFPVSHSGSTSLPKFPQITIQFNLLRFRNIFGFKYCIYSIYVVICLSGTWPIKLNYTCNNLRGKFFDPIGEKEIRNRNWPLAIF